jgi:hypothetical protein
MSSGALEFPEIAIVYARYSALASATNDLSGSLVLYSGVSADGISIAMACNIAGAASLGIEPDPTLARQALRAGVCDFLVNTLDESLRILKNEIRQRRPVSVLLTSDLNPVLEEMVSRGVQPEILAFPVPELIKRGAYVLAEDVDSGLIPLTWSVAKEPMRWLPALDALAVASLVKDASLTDLRLRWLEASPRYLGKKYSGQRYLRMDDSEIDAFVAAVRAAIIRERAVPIAVSVKRGGEEVLWRPRFSRRRTELPPRRP